MSNVINDNRKIKIIRTTATKSEVTKSSWKNNLSRVLSERLVGKGKTSIFGDTITSNSLDSLNVNDDIDLYLTSMPSLTIQNSSDTPVKELVKKAKDTLNKVSIPIPGHRQNLHLADVIDKSIFYGSSLFNNITGKEVSTASTFSPWAANVPAWKLGEKSGGLDFDLTFEFSMGMYGLWSAREEVVLPILNLLAPVLPQYLSAWTIAGPYATASDLLVDSITGLFSDIKQSFNKDKKDGGSTTTTTETALSEEESSSFLTKIGDFFENLILEGYKNYTFDISFGNFITINKVLFNDCKLLEWDSNVDQYGYPVSGKIEIGFKGIIPPSLSSSSSNNMALRLMGAGN